jgi:hypothetical protein
MAVFALRPLLATTGTFPRVDPRELARQIAIARLATGVVLMALPKLSARVWLGSDGARPAGRILTRALGAREVAIGSGVLLAMRRDAPVRGWVEAGAFVDGVDFALMLGAGDRVPAASRWGVALAAGAGAAAGAAVAPGLEQASDYEPRADA